MPMELHHLSEWRVHTALWREYFTHLQASRGMRIWKILLVITNIWLFTYNIVQLCTCRPDSLSSSVFLVRWKIFGTNNRKTINWTNRTHVKITIQKDIFKQFLWLESLFAVHPSQMFFFLLEIIMKKAFCLLSASLLHKFSVRHTHCFAAADTATAAVASKMNFVHPPNDKYSEI